jgi:asparagine synthase (glutamine-hydrolysing)
MEPVKAMQWFGEYLDDLDQPSIDGFNTWCVSRFAHQCGATVALSGLGGDELFGGYPAFWRVPHIFRASRALAMAGAGGRRAVGNLLEQAAGPRWRRLGNYFASEPSVEGAWRCFRGVYTACEGETLAAMMAGELGFDEAHGIRTNGLKTRDEVAVLEIESYMRNQLLRDSDVMSMAHGLELRVPFLDRDFIETTLAIPEEARLQKGKDLLVRAVPELPAWVKSHPKRGFTFPFGQWMNGEWESMFREVRQRFGGAVRLDSWGRMCALLVLEEWRKRLADW